MRKRSGVFAAACLVALTAGDAGTQTAKSESAASAAASPTPKLHVPLVRPASGDAKNHHDGYRSGGAALEVEPAGLALLRSPALKDTPVRTIAVRGTSPCGRPPFDRWLVRTDRWTRVLAECPCSDSSAWVPG